MRSVHVSELARKRSFLLRVALLRSAEFPIVAERVHTAPAESKGQTASGSACVLRKAVMTAPGACTMGAHVFVPRKALISPYSYRPVRAFARALFALVATERDSDTSQDARDDGWLAATEPLEVAVKAVERHSVPVGSRELYRAVVEPERVRRRLHKVVLLRFVLVVDQVAGALRD